MFEALLSALGGGGGAAATAGADSADIGSALASSGSSDSGFLAGLERLASDSRLNMLISLGTQLGGSIAGKDTTTGQISEALGSMAQSNIMANRQAARESRQDTMMRMLGDALAGKFTPAGTPGPTQLMIGADGFRLKADPDKTDEIGDLFSGAGSIQPDSTNQESSAWYSEYSTRLDNMMKGF